MFQTFSSSSYNTKFGAFVFLTITKSGTNVIIISFFFCSDNKSRRKKEYVEVGGENGDQLLCRS